MSIPKIIHLCWFGSKNYPALVDYCIKSWKSILKDFKIMVWNEESFDVDSTIWTKEAYERNNFAFVSDYVRLFALNKYGGIYLDTDVEIIKDLTPLLTSDKFICSFIEGQLVSMGLMMCKKHDKYINELLKYYNNRHFINGDGSMNRTMNTLVFTNILVKKYGLPFGINKYESDDIIIYPLDYFMPYKKNVFLDKTNKKSYIITGNTYTIHHDMGSWSLASKTKKTLKGVVRLFVPQFIYLKLKINKNRKKIKSM